MPYEILKSELKYKGRIVEVVNDEITLPNGATAWRELVLRGSASAVVPIDSEGNVTLVRQYRHGAKQMVLEIPAGMVDEGEEPADCAVRELEEETGLVAGKVVKLLEYYVSAGYCSEVLYVYLATELSTGERKPDPEEFLEIEKHPLNEVSAKIMSGEIVDSKTICGILAAKELLLAK